MAEKIASAPESEKKPAETMHGWVSRGRTVQVGNGYVVKYNQVQAGGQIINVPEHVPMEGKPVYNEGEEIELPRAEFLRLHGLGFVRMQGEPEYPAPTGTLPKSEFDSTV
jgi:hypothetical protein